MDLVLGDQHHLAGLEDTMLASTPLLGLTRKDVNDFLAGGMPVKSVATPGVEGGPDQQQRFARHDVGP